MFRKVVGYNDILEIIESVPPEGGVPDPVDFVYGLIFLFQPFPEFLFTVFAVAYSAILVGDMPGDDIVIFFVALGQCCGQGGGIFLVGGTVGTGIVPAAEFAFHAVFLHAQDVGMFSGHPGGMGACGSGETYLKSMGFYQFHDFVQFFEMIGVIIGL